MGLVAQHGEITCNIFSDVEDAEKCFHVLATLLEAGHGSTFQHLPRWRHGCWGRGEGVWSSFGVYSMRVRV